MEAPSTSQASSSGSEAPTTRPYKAARFWIPVWIFLLTSGLALWQSPRPDALRPPRWVASIAWWRYPLEWNAANRLPKIECSLNAIQAVPNTTSVWAVGNKGMVVTSSDGGRTWTKKSPDQAALATSPTPLPVQSNPSPSQSSSRANASPTATPSPSFGTTLTPSETEPLIAIYFSDAKRGEAMGDLATRFATNDGGDSWVKDDTYLNIGYRDWVFSNELSTESLVRGTVSNELPWEAPALPFSNAYISPHSDSFWVATRDFGYLLRLGKERAPAISLSVYTYPLRLASGIYFLADQTNGWFVTKDGFVYDTKDKGLSWSRLLFYLPAALHGVFFVSEQRGWIVGAN